MGQHSLWIDKAQALPPFSIPSSLSSYTSTDEYPEGLWFRLMCVNHETEAKLMGAALWLAYEHYEKIWEESTDAAMVSACEIIDRCERNFFRDGRIILQHFADKVPVNPEHYDNILEYVWGIGGDCDDAPHFTETLDSVYIPYNR